MDDNSSIYSVLSSVRWTLIISGEEDVAQINQWVADFKKHHIELQILHLPGNAFAFKDILVRPDWHIAFSGKLARGIINKFITRMQIHEKDILDYPLQNALTTAMRKEAVEQNCVDFMSMWAGQSAYLCSVLPAGKIIQELNKQVVALLANQA